MFSCSKQTINKILTKNNIKFRDHSHASRKYKLDENIFENIDTHEKAYWLGMLAGDGCVNVGNINKPRNELKLSLQERDKEYVYKFKDFLKTDRPIFNVNNGKRKNGTNSISYILSIDSKKIVNDLAKYKIIPNKTYGMEFPNISNIYLPSYILGLIDSDGSIYLKTHYKNKDIKLLNFSFIGPIQFVKTLQKILIEKCNISETKFYISKESNFIAVIHYGGYKNIYKIIKYIYSQSKIFFIRKKSIAINYLITKYPKDEWLLNNIC